MYLTQCIKRTALLKPREIATIFKARTRTWQESVDRISRFAGGLRALGVQADERVAILALNSDRYFEYYFAVPWAGAAVVPLNVRWSVPENVYALEDSGARVLVVDDAFVEHAHKIMQDYQFIDSVIYAGDEDTPTGMLNMEELIASTDPIDDDLRSKDDLAGIFYTGGTTGFPKGVMLSHLNLWSSSIIEVAEGAGGVQGGAYLHVAPMFHLADGHMVFVETMLGNCQVFLEQFDPGRVLEQISEHGVASMLLVPTMIKMLLDHPEFDSYDLSSLRRISYGASPISETLLREAFEKLPNTTFDQGYGQTEMSPLVCRLPAEDHQPEGPNKHRLRSAGRPVIGLDVKIADKNLNELPRGKVGQILTRGPNSMMGYWNKPKETQETLVNGWMLSGDAGYMDEDGYVYLVDRVKDMIVSGGENVYSAEVENALLAHPAVSEAAVIGIPHDRWGEAVHAILILKPGQDASEESILEFCHHHTAAYKCPKTIEFRETPLPLSGAGKVLKKDLRAPYWKNVERKIG